MVEVFLKNMVGRNLVQKENLTEIINDRRSRYVFLIKNNNNKIVTNYDLLKVSHLTYGSF